MKLRNHQSKAIEMVKASLGAGNKRPMLQLPTAAGKTFIAAEIIKSALSKGSRVIFCVPAISLIDQSVEAFKAAGISGIGVIQGDHEGLDRSQPVQVCSVQTLARRKIPDAELVIVDEAHMRFKSLYEWMDAWSNVPFIGLSATPWVRGLGLYFDDLIKPITMRELISLGFLSDYTAYAGSSPDLKGVKVTAGDYNKKGLAEVVMDTTLIADIVPTWLKLGENEQTIFFATDCAHARAAQAEFVDAGIECAYIDAYTTREERAEIFEQFTSHSIKVIANVGTLTTGLDLDVRCLILARPTKSKSLYVQIIGRALRINTWLSNAVAIYQESGHDAGCLVALKPHMIDEIESQLKDMGVSSLRVIASGEYIREPFFLEGAKPNKRRAIIIDHSSTMSALGFPEDIDQDKLDCNEPDEPPTLEEIDELIERQEALPKACMKCKTLKPAGERTCPNCGYTPEKQSEIVHEKGELYEIKKGIEKKLEIQAAKDKAAESNRRFTADSTAKEKLVVHAEIVGYCESKGKAEGYASYLYKDFYGVWPKGKPTGVEPSPGLINKIKARNIRYAKRRK